MCVTFLLCSPRADLWPLYGFLFMKTVFSLKAKVNGKPYVWRENRFHKTHKSAINRPVDGTGETQHTLYVRQAVFY